MHNEYKWEVIKITKENFYNDFYNELKKIVELYAKGEDVMELMQELRTKYNNPPPSQPDGGIDPGW
ncbi:hypothetical protein [Chengkuizengella marina]|nr:hypothetical protein [Chengkuizengella marina]